MTRFWIQFSNGYTNKHFQAMRNIISNVKDENNGISGRWLINNINSKILDVVSADTVDEANESMLSLVAYVQGIIDTIPDFLPLHYMYAYLYDALCLATVVPYADRLDD